MQELEGTPEFNRNHRLLNQAGLDPYLDRPIPNQQPLHQPRTDEELYDKWQEYVNDELDEYSKQYHPFQEVVPDTREGFDENGDYHAIYHQPELPFNETNVYESVGKALTPYRWASYLQDALNQYISTFDYTVGGSERDDIVQDIVTDRMERAATMEERHQLEEALQMWRETYGHGA